MIYKTKNTDAPAYFLNGILGELYSKGIDCWLAGGAIRDFFMGTNATDYDIYFPNQYEFNKAKSYLESMNAPVKWESENGIKFKHRGKVLDLVKIYNSSPQDTISRFDYTVCSFAIYGDTLFYSENAFKDLNDRKIVINYITNPESSLKRAFKYQNKGFSITASESSKLYNALKDLPRQYGEGDDFRNFRNASATDVSSGETMPPPDDIDIITTPNPVDTPTVCPAGTHMGSNGQCQINNVTPPVDTPVDTPVEDTPIAKIKKIVEEKDLIPYILAGMTLMLSLVSEKK